MRNKNMNFQSISKRPKSRSSFPLLLVTGFLVLSVVSFESTSAFQIPIITTTTTTITTRIKPALGKTQITTDASFRPSLNNNVRQQTSTQLSLSASDDTTAAATTKTAISESTTTTTTTTTNDKKTKIEISVQQLKKVLEREYLSFFNPMEKEWYSSTVTFEDPLTSLSGIDAYQKNVDMLSGRNLFGNILFGNRGDARILLHTITGGAVTETNDGNIVIADIITRWTLQFTFQALPWKPVPQFSGISVYKVQPTTATSSSTTDVEIIRQDDYWDSINLVPDGTGSNYIKVDKSIALKHFASLTGPSSFQANAAGPELPYRTLRLGRISTTKPMEGQYEVRQYPSYTAIQIPYKRRDEAFTLLGALTEGMKPLAPTYVTFGDGSKTMVWPLRYELPTEPFDTSDEAITKIKQQILDRNGKEYDGTFDIVVVPEKIVAVGRFSEVIVESVVRKVHNQLQTICQEDGLQSTENSNTLLTFAQYDAIYSMGKRRSEVHIELQQGGHPW